MVQSSENASQKVVWSEQLSPRISVMVICRQPGQMNTKLDLQHLHCILMSCDWHIKTLDRFDGPIFSNGVWTETATRTFSKSHIISRKGALTVTAIHKLTICLLYKLRLEPFKIFGKANLVFYNFCEMVFIDIWTISPLKLDRSISFICFVKMHYFFYSISYIIEFWAEYRLQHFEYTIKEFRLKIVGSCDV